eukprot:jgi/Hompol1/3352/HPOL_006534-RA
MRFKKIAELHYGWLGKPDNEKLIELTDDMIPCLQNGTLIFVDATDVDKFLERMFPKITTTFVLISGDSDASMPGGLSQELLRKALDSPLILHWFAMNCDRNPDPKRFTCLMLGVNQWDHYPDKVQAAIESGYPKLPKD